MNNQSTTSLLEILKNTPIDELDNFIAENDGTYKINEYFSTYMYKNNIKTSDIVNNLKGYISKSYIYEILNGTKTNPSRDNIILICLAAKMDLKSTRRTLEIFNHRNLYPKDNRDAIIAICINNGIFDIESINDRLFEYSEPTFNVK